MDFYYCQGLLLKEYHSNERGGSREDGRSWREFASLVRRDSNSQPKTQVQKDEPGTASASFKCEQKMRGCDLRATRPNPVMERLVKHPKGWPWGSFSFYANDEAGLIGIDPVE
jgi:hypothetical protein